MLQIVFLFQLQKTPNKSMLGLPRRFPGFSTKPRPIIALEPDAMKRPPTAVASGLKVLTFGGEVFAEEGAYTP